MESAIHVGSVIEGQKETIEAMALAISTILVTGSETHAEQATIKEALETFGRLAQVSGVTITNSVFSGDKVVNFGEDDN